MKRFKDLSIGIRLALILVGAMTLLAAGIMAAFIVELDSYASRDKIEVRDDLLAKTKEEQRNYVQQAYGIVKYFYDTSVNVEKLKEKTRADLKRVVDGVANQALEYYRANRDFLSLEEIHEHIKANTRNARFDGDNYVWINDLVPAMIMHPTNPKLDGQDLSTYRDPEGVYLFKEMVEVCKKDGEGTVTYMWDKPGVQGKPSPKVSYVRLVPELGWIFGSGAWLEDVTGEMKAQALKQLADLRLVDGNYFFVISDTLPIPTTIMQPTNPGLNGKPMDAPVFDSATAVESVTDGRVIRFQEGKKNLGMAMVEAVQKGDQGFVHYEWTKPLPGGGVSAEFYPKLGFVRLFAPWNWIIGMGEYIDDIDILAEARAQAIHETVNTVILKLSLASLAFLVLVVVFILLAIRYMLNRPVRSLVDFAGHVADGHLDATISGRFTAEMDRLRLSIEKMVANLKSELAFVRGILNSVTMPSVVVDPGGKVILLNRWLAHFLGEKKEPTAYIDRPLREVFTSHPKVAEVLRTVLDKREIVTNFEYEGTYAWGERFYVKIDAAPIHGPQGEVLGVFALLATLTRFKIQQEALAEKNRLISETARSTEAIAAQVAEESENLNSLMAHTNQGVSRQQDRSQETATAMEEMNATVLEVASNAAKAAENADESMHKAREGSSIVEDVRGAITQVNAQTETLKANMGRLSAQAEDIGRIMVVISDIADQTNLLALNAAIEAARAGDAGRGFAVVADEVRKLAEKTMTATKEVGTAIQAIQDGARHSNQETEKAAKAVTICSTQAEKAGMALMDIVTMAEGTADQIRAIATASEEQSATATEINRATDEINEVADEIKQGMEESVQSIERLRQNAVELNRLIGQMQAGTDKTH